MPPIPHDPQVTLDSFTYTPASPIHVGDTLTFTAALNKHTDAGWLRVRVGSPVLFMAHLSDTGFDADATAGDGIYTGRFPWYEKNGTGENLEVQVRLVWEDGAPEPTLSAPPLTVLPAEEGQQ